MLSLEYEIGLLLTISAIIGVLMGRFLCKSGEIEQRSKKEEFKKIFELSQSKVKNSEIIITELKTNIQDEKNNTAKLEQTITNLNTKLSSSNSQRVKILDDLRELEKYETRFKALDSEFKLQSNLVEKLKKEKSLNIQKLESSTTLITILNQKVKDTQEKSDKIIIINNNQTKELKDFHKIYKDNKILIEKIEKLEKLLEQKNNQYNLIENEYKNYKSSIKIDNKRLIFLEKEYNKTNQILDITITQRDDLLSRIRAISSVVEAVGVEN